MKPKIAVTPLIRRALEDLIDRANRKVITISEQDRMYAQTMLDRLAEFSSEYAVDPRHEETDSLAKSEQWLDQQWQLIRDECFDRMRKLAEGAAFIESDFVMVRKVLSVVCVDLMADMRRQLVDRLIR